MNNNTARDLLTRIRLDELASAVKTLSATIGSLDRNGGVLCIAVIDSMQGTTTSLASTSVGIPGFKITRYAFNAHEKIQRLRARREAGKKDVASSETADNATTYGGAIAFHDGTVEVYISFSGAPPEVDEAIVYALGETLGLSCPEYANGLQPLARQLMKDVILKP